MTTAQTMLRGIAHGSFVGVTGNRQRLIEMKHALVKSNSQRKRHQLKQSSKKRATAGH